LAELCSLRGAIPNRPAHRTMNRQGFIAVISRRHRVGSMSFA
jgi:hypothetical protein